MPPLPEACAMLLATASPEARSEGIALSADAMAQCCVEGGRVVLSLGEQVSLKPGFGYRRRLDLIIKNKVQVHTQVAAAPT